MAQPRVCVLRAPGTNCDVETAHAFETCGARAQRMHLFRLLEQPGLLKEFQILCIPGGFSYGDDVGAGVVFGSSLRSHLGEEIREFLSGDRLVLGICNGFQVLMKSGILPGGSTTWPPKDAVPPATLTWNLNGKYTALWVNLKVGPTQNAFLRGIDEIELPVAHAEGRIAVREPAVLEAWRQNGQIALQYTPSANGCDAGEAGADSTAGLLPYPVNPNGSQDNIAGLGDPSGRVLGLMPHPERFLHATQHPQWTRRQLRGEGAGLRIFRNGVAHFA